MSYFYSTCFTVPKLQVELEAAKQRELELLAVIARLQAAADHVIENLGTQYHVNGVYDFYKITHEVVAVLGEAVDSSKGASSQALREHEAKVIAEYKQDAERYRWVRDECTAEKSPQHTWIVESPGDLWDAAIDAAMTEERRKK